MGMLRLVIIAVLWNQVWRIQDLYPTLGTIRFPLIMTAASLLLFIASKSALQTVRRRAWHPVMKVSGVLLLLMCLSIPTSLYPGLSFNFLLTDHLQTLLLLVLVVASVRTLKDLERFAIAQLIGGAVFAFYALRIDIGDQGRLGDLPYYDANDLAMMLVGTLPLALYFVRRGMPPLVRAFAVLVSGLYLMTLLKTGSRGGFLGLIAVGLFVLLTFKALSTRVRIGSVVAGFLVLNIFGSDFFWKQMGTLLHPQDDYNWSGNEQGRMEVWKRGMGYMWARPISGVGVRAFGVAEGTISPLASRQNLGIGVRWEAAHNSFVQIGAELGVPGLLAFIWLLVAAFLSLRPAARRRTDSDPEQRKCAAMAQALRACLIGYAVSGFFLSQAYAAFLYATLGLIVALVYISRRGPGRVPRRRRARLSTPQLRPLASA